MTENRCSPRHALQLGMRSATSAVSFLICRLHCTLQSLTMFADKTPLVHGANNSQKTDENSASAAASEERNSKDE